MSSGVNLQKTVEKNCYLRRYKKAVDYVAACACLVLLWPLMVLIALWIKASSHGPVIYSQERCGRYGRRFTLYKFRTMKWGSEDQLGELQAQNEADGPVFKIRNDPRVATSFHRLLRRSELDELPQLWNVLRGDMSMVGPRPPLPSEVKAYSAFQMTRLHVKPGLTCTWQIQPKRNKIGFDKWAAMDVDYIASCSFSLDLTIMIKTIPAVFLGHGV